MRILFTICGRAGSKGIKNKNIKNLLDKPLVRWTISAIDLLVKSESFNKNFEYDIALNTDSSELLDIVNSNSMENVEYIARKDILAGDNVGKIDVVRDTYFSMCDKKKVDYDIIIDLDITSPLRTRDDIENLINKFISSNVDVVYSVTESRRNPYFNMVQRNKDGKIEKVINSKCTSRQQAPIVYDLNASLYAYSPKFLRQNLQLFDARSEIIEMIDTAVLDLDKPSDFELMEVLANYFINNNHKYNEVYKNIV